MRLTLAVYAKAQPVTALHVMTRYLIKRSSNPGKEPLTKNETRRKTPNPGMQKRSRTGTPNRPASSINAQPTSCLYSLISRHNGLPRSKSIRIQRMIPQPPLYSLGITEPHNAQKCLHLRHCMTSARLSGRTHAVCPRTQRVSHVNMPLE